MARAISYYTSLTELTHQRNFASFSISGVSRQEYRDFCAASYTKFSDRRTLLLAEEYAETEFLASSVLTNQKREPQTRSPAQPTAPVPEKPQEQRPIAPDNEPPTPQAPSSPPEAAKTEDLETSLVNKSREEAEMAPSGLSVEFEDESVAEEETESPSQAAILPASDTPAQLPETQISGHRQLSSVLEEKVRADSAESEELRKFKELPSVRRDEEELSCGMPEGVEQVRDYMDHKIEESSYPEHDKFTESEESVTEYSHPELEVSRSEDMVGKDMEQKEEEKEKKEKKTHHRILLKGLKKIFKRKKKKNADEKEMSESERDSGSSGM